MDVNMNRKAKELANKSLHELERLHLEKSQAVNDFNNIMDGLERRMNTEWARLHAALTMMDDDK